jgi:hypothetical protein
LCPHDARSRSVRDTADSAPFSRGGAVHVGDVMIEAEGVSCDVHRRPRFLEDRRLLVCLPRGD